MENQILTLVNELLKMTQNNEIQWKKKNPKILSGIPGGNAIISVFSTKFKNVSIYICTRKYIEKRHDPRLGEYTEDVYKKSILAFDGVELLYMIDCKADQNYSFSFNELFGLIQNTVNIFFEENILK
jgi:hypothetical protein